jgi:ribose transport system substrate-binding protein
MKRIYPFFLALTLVCFFPGCDNGGKTTGNASGKKFHLAFVTNTKNDFWTAVQRGCNNSAQNLGNVDLDFRFFTGSTADEQNAIVNDLVAKGVDGIAISPIDAQKQTDFLNQIAAKTLLVCVDSDAVNSKRACFIGIDNVAAGKQAAGLLKAALPRGGKVILFVGYPNAQNARDRIQGLKGELADSNLQIIDTMADETKTDVAQKNAQDALSKYPDIAGLIGLYSYNGPAILKAVRAAGKNGKVKVVCFDDDNETLGGIAAGDIYGTVVQLSTRIGYDSINRMGKYLSGDKTQLAQGSILFNSLPVTKDMVESVQAWHQDMLQP